MKSMQHTLFKSIFAALLGVVLQTPLQAEQHALLIGISDYQHDGIEDLEGPIHDVSALHNVLVEKWELTQKNVVTLVNEQASEKNIRTAFQSLIEDTKAGDDIMIYFSGHGTSVADKHFGAKLNLPDGSGALVTYDFNPVKHRNRIKANIEAGDEVDGLLIGRYEIKQLLQTLSQDRTVWVIFDSCFSGNAATRSLNRGFVPLQNRLLNIKLGTEYEPEVKVGNTGASRCTECAVNDNERTFDYENVVYFGAANDTQEAIDISSASIKAGMQTIDGKPHGGFTDALLRQLNNPELIIHESLSYRKLFNLTNSTFRRYCEQCGHDPVLLPLNDSNALSKIVMSKHEGGKTKSESPALLSFELESITPELQIATANLPKLTRKAITALESVKETDTHPDIELYRTANHYEARLANGQFITRFPLNTAPSKLSHWLQAQSWLKLRKLNDTENNQGTIGAIFRNPLSNPVAFANELVTFTISLDADAKLVMLVTNSKGKVSLLYPVNSFEADTVFKAEESFTFPNRAKIKIQVTEPWGTDNVVFYALPPDSTLNQGLLELASMPEFSHTEPLLTRFTDSLDSGKTPYGAAHVRFHSTN